MGINNHWNGADQAPAAALEAIPGAYQLRQPRSAARLSARPARRHLFQDVARHLAEAALAILRLTIPTALLLILLAAAYLYSDAPLSDYMPMVAPAFGLNVSDVILPLTWLTILLTNRCYGAEYAFAQMSFAMAVGAAILLSRHSDLNVWISMPALSPRVAACFVAAFLISNFFGIVVFDGARGPKWWSVPLVASLMIAVTFSAIYYPAAFAGTPVNWLTSAVTHSAVFLAEAILLLMPYYALRSAMPPLHGLNGY